jgi:ribosomal protein S18 acetylase RimI-like enzyme
MTSARLDPIFVNHLAFLAAHRGEVILDGRGVTVRSAMPGFSSFTPWDEGSALPDDAAAVRLMPSSGDWAPRLAAQGWRKAEALVYMALDPDAALEASAPPGVRIAVASTDADAEAFADAQAAGFEAAADDSDGWRSRMRAAALANAPRADQTFHMALVDGRPAAVSLTVRAAGAAGIYAVATRPEHRRKGLSTALLARSQADARAAGLDAVVLQVMAGSYAEAFYRKLGFKERYVSQVWRRD